MRLRAIAIDGVVGSGAGAWFWWMPPFDQAMHAIGTVLVVGTLAVRFAIAVRDYRRGPR
jgi:hypothetical protein